jgi:hypothetical protein
MPLPSLKIVPFIHIYIYIYLYSKITLNFGPQGTICSWRSVGVKRLKCIHFMVQ